jgi:hypothetical protein
MGRATVAMARTMPLATVAMDRPTVATGRATVALSRATVAMIRATVATGRATMVVAIVVVSTVVPALDIVVVSTVAPALDTVMVSTVAPALDTVVVSTVAPALDTVVVSTVARPPGGKQPYYFTARDGSPILSIAGLWDEWEDKEAGRPLKSCTMIITEPNKFIAEVHDRMPVLLEPEQFEPWLDGSAGTEILRPARKDLLQKWPVSKRVNTSRTSGYDPTLIEPATI